MVALLYISDINSNLLRLPSAVRKQLSVNRRFLHLLEKCHDARHDTNWIRRSVKKRYCGSKERVKHIKDFSEKTVILNYFELAAYPVDATFETVIL